jgi:xylulokinase
VCFIGLDLGTTGVKAIAFDTNGKPLSSSYREYPLIHPQPGWSELDPVNLFNNVKTVLAEVSSELHTPLQAIGISSQGQAVVPIDRDGRTLYNIIVTFDGRTIPQYNWWLDNTIQKEIFLLTGLPLSSIYTVNKIMWHKKNNPDIYEKSWKFCCVQDYIIYLLSGETAIDHSLAGRTMMLNPQKKEWDEKILKLAGIANEKLSTPVSSTTVVGKIRGVIADELGLPQDVSLVVGGHDQTCGALGAGVIHPGMAMNATGTVDALLVVLPKFTTDNVLLNNNYCCYPHSCSEKYVSLALNPNGGLLLKWYKDTFCKEESLLAQEKGRDVYTDIINNSSDKISDIYILPHLEGAGTPILDPESLGAIVGLRVSHTKQDICRAVLESIAYDMRQNIHAMESTGNVISEIRAIGGGAKTPKWLQIKADIFGKKIVTLRIGESAAMGAAILAGVGMGEFSSYSEAIDQMIKIDREYLPNDRLQTEYGERFDEYTLIYPALQKLNQRISRRSRV